MNHQTILILDYGSQTTQLIARRIREAGVYCEIHPCTLDPAEVRAMEPTGLILSGGPMSVYDEGAPQLDPSLLDLRQPSGDGPVPVLGICYGLQAMAHTLGGKVEPSDHREFGRADLVGHAETPLFAGIPAHTTVWMSHGDHLTQLPPGFQSIAATQNAPIAAVAHEERPLYGVQFHPEVVHTDDGAQLLANFAREVCGCRGDWTTESFIDEKVREIRETVGEDHVVLGLSGGVDSSVAAALIHKAIGDQLTCIFVDNGLLRQGEFEQVQDTFREGFGLDLRAVDASDLFLSRLADVADPEKKRKIIGGLFIDVFEEEAKKVGGADFLAQGTLYPDVIESVSALGGPSVTIKSHHNVGGLPERMNMQLVEPLRELFKDEVRALGRELGLPEAFIGRHPFPGPGLAIRIPGEITREKADTLRKADAIYIEEIKKAGLYDEIWQAFSVLLPVNTVGVMGDLRTYEAVLALRAVTSTDGMTADYYPFPHDFLGRVATRIINEVKGVNRVVYDVTSKPPGTIEWE